LIVAARRANTSDFRNRKEEGNGREQRAAAAPGPPAGRHGQPPGEIAERLPDEAEVEFALRGDDGVIEMKLVELVRKPLKLK
jgi:hypothetical protein